MTAPRTITIAQIEGAINHWRERRPATGQEHTLCLEVNVLGDVYGEMIFARRDTVLYADLTEVQKEAFQLTSSPP